MPEPHSLDSPARAAEAGPLGILGVGLLGTALAERALAAGLPVVGFDVDPARRTALERLGGGAAPTAAGVAAACPVLLLVLPDDRVVDGVLEEIGGALRPGALLLDVTTGDPEVAAARAADLRPRGVEYLDATLSGSSAQARRGEALFMVGGSDAAFARCRDLLTRLAGQAVHAGPSGAGSRMKLVTNLVLGLNRAALAEGLALAEVLGLDPGRTLAALRAGAAYSRMMDTKGEKMLTRRFEPEARLSQHLKDVRLILAAGADAGQPLPLSRAHCDLLERAEELGLGGLDNSAVIGALEAMRTRSEDQ